MTELHIRDHFATAALTGSFADDEWSLDEVEERAKWAYRQADAMMAARDIPPEKLTQGEDEEEAP